jgi:protocatechuate 3,4-dioxygenase beta subunit
VELMRRSLALVFLALGTLAACGPAVAPASQSVRTPASQSATTSPQVTAATTASGCSGVATVSQTEGPYFKSGSPAKGNLVEAGMGGTRLTLTGHVYNTRCAPLAGAVLDFWQADSNGTYDNSGYRLRGHQAAAASGTYRLDTVIPGLYPGRTEHIHVKVTPPGASTLTTQLYFPGVARNSEDGIFDARMLVTLGDAPVGKAASFDFVLKAG